VNLKKTNVKFVRKIKMIEAQPARWAKFIFHHYVMRLMRRHFSGFHLLSALPQIEAQLPLLLLPNHSTWWDGFFIHFLNEIIFKRNAYLMMLESQLRKYRFFARVGAYGVNPEKPKSLLQSLDYTVQLFRNPANAPVLICIFPQGILLPWGKRPLAYRRGIEWILHKYERPVNMLPLAIRAEFLNEQRPEVFFRFGENSIVHSANYAGTDRLEATETELLADLNQQIIAGESGVNLLEGQASVNRLVDRFKQRKLAPKVDQ